MSAQQEALKQLTRDGKWHTERCIDEAFKHVRALYDDKRNDIPCPRHEWIDLAVIAYLGYMAETGTQTIPEDVVDARLRKFLEKLPMKFTRPLPGDPE